MQLGNVKEKVLFHSLKKGDYTSPVQEFIKNYKCLRREGAGITLLLALFLLLISFILFVLLLVLEHLGVNFHLLDVKVGMETTDLPFVELEALTKILGSCKFNSFLEVV